MQELFLTTIQSYIYQVLQTIHMKLILLCVWAEPAVLGSAKTALKFIYTLQSLTGKLQGRITTQGDHCSHYREWVCSEVADTYY